MIVIQNIGPHDGSDLLGVREYEVRINQEVICRFRHRRGDGLARCLLEASKAVGRQQWEGLAGLEQELVEAGVLTGSGIPQF